MLDTTIQDPTVVAPPADSPAPPVAAPSPTDAVVDPATPASTDATPTAAAAPEATGAETPPPAPAVSPEMREYVATLERERAEARAQEDMRALHEETTRYAQRLQAEQGLTPEQADYVARREGQQAQREYQQTRVRGGASNAPKPPLLLLPPPPYTAQTRLNATLRVVLW